MPDIEKETKETSLQTIKEGNYMGTISWKKLASWAASKQKSSSPTTGLYKDNKCKRERRSKRKRSEMREDKWSSRQKPTWLNSGEYYPKVAVKQSGKIK